MAHFIQQSKTGEYVMNANELAEIQAFKTEELTMWERNHTATMLRQQQAEIEALKQIIDANNLSQNIGQFVKPTNEPVALMTEYGIQPLHEGALQEGQFFYTHPVKEQDTDCQYCKQGCIRCDARKQLTDEEIIACIDEIEPDTADMIRFARAILKRAFE